MTFEDFEKEWESDSIHIGAQTSGSTGTPKRILLSKENMRNGALRTLKFLFGENLERLRHDALFHSCIAADYIGGKALWVRAKISDSRFSWEKPSNCPLADFDASERIDMLSVVPSQLLSIVERIENGNGKELPELGVILVGGAPLNTSLRERGVAAGLDIWETYGMTETCSHIALRAGKDSLCDRRAPFIPLEGVRVRIDDRGCLAISVDDCVVCTNDLAKFDWEGDPNGNWNKESWTSCPFHILGRYDNVIISGGIKLIPEKIEDELRPIISSLGYSEFALTSRPDSLWGEALTLIVEGDLTEELKGQIKLKSREKLSSHCVPKHILALPSLPRLAGGKLDRLALRNNKEEV